MTLNERIAKALGEIYAKNDPGVSVLAVLNESGGYTMVGTLKPYSSSLDLIYELEMTLTHDEQLWYLNEIFVIINRDHKPPSTYVTEWYFRHATAAQCAEAIAIVLEGRTHGE